MTNSFMKEIERSVEKVVVGLPNTYDVVQINVDPQAKVITAYAEELHASICAGVDLHGGTFALEDDFESFKHYLADLVVARVKYVRNERAEVNPTDKIVVPSFLACVLANVGKVSHLDLGLDLEPQIMPKDYKPHFKREELIRVSNQLRVLGKVGLEFSLGYPREKTGSFEFMAMTLINSAVLSVDKGSHPVYALLSSTLGVQGIEAVLSPRITYGNENHFINLVRTLAALK